MSGAIQRYANKVTCCPSCGEPRDNLRRSPDGDWMLHEAHVPVSDALFNLLAALGQHEQPADVIAACEAASAALIASGRVMG